MMESNQNPEIAVFVSCRRSRFISSELRFMPYEQVGEQNQKILYKHYMDTGEIKDSLLTKIWLYALQWFFTYCEGAW